MKKYFIILFVNISILNTAVAQLSNKDLDLLINYKKTETTCKYTNSKTKLPNSKIMFNPIKFSLNLSMYIYQNYISPVISSDCAYDLSCSNYSKYAIIEYGYIKGVFLSADRLMRCQIVLKKEVPAYKINPVTEKMIDTPDSYKFKEK